ADVPPVPAPALLAEAAGRHRLDGLAALQARHRGALHARPPTPPGRMSDLDRAIEFSRAFDRRRVEEVVRAEHGEALLTPSLPLVYHRNHFSVDLGADLSAQELIREAAPL